MNGYAEESLGWKAPTRKWISRYWWVVLFLFLCGTIYGHSIRKKEEIIRSLDTQLMALERESRGLMDVQEDLRLQIASHDDPAWIQLTLMKVLGLVPEGQSKVYFYNEPAASSSTR